MEEDKPNACQELLLDMQVKAISAMIGGLLKEVFKLENIVGPLFIQNKWWEISAKPEINAGFILKLGP